MKEEAKQLIDLLMKYGFEAETALYVTAQTILETGNFTSRIYKSNNNLFGMKMPKHRPTTALFEQHKHAFYATAKESVADFLIWLTYNYIWQDDLKDFERYKMKFEKIKYSTTADYNERVNTIYLSLKTEEQ